MRGQRSQTWIFSERSQAWCQIARHISLRRALEKSNCFWSDRFSAFSDWNIKRRLPGHIIRWMRVGVWSAAMDDGCKSNKSLLGGTCGSAEVSPEQGVVGIWHSCIYNLICNTSDKCIHVYTSVYNLICNTTPHEYTSVLYLICDRGIRIYSGLYLLPCIISTWCPVSKSGCLFNSTRSDWMNSTCVQDTTFVSGCVQDTTLWKSRGAAFLSQLHPTTSLIWPPFQLLVSPSIGFSSLVSLLWFPS